MRFRDNYYFLSNMYRCPVTVNIDGTEYTFSCVESAFQAHKCPERAGEFVAVDGYTAKKLGRRIPLRTDWEEIKEEVMFSCLQAKFRNPDLRARLIAVTEPIVEDNTWGDTYWGMCNGRGQNRLGKLLEKVRGSN